MTKLAKQILELALNGLDATQILSQGVGSSEYEIEFILEQLKCKGELNAC